MERNDRGFVMSLRRIGSRAVVVGLGVLASLALMAAPSWATKGGNSANAALCEPGGYPGVLFNQQAEGFKNAGACTKYAAKGGQIAGVNATHGSQNNGGTFDASWSGFGLKPGSSVNGCSKYSPEGFEPCYPTTVASNGTFFVDASPPCEEEFPIDGFEKVGHLVVEATTAEGTFFVREFPPPSVC
jgi:hypothetical protein